MTTKAPKRFWKSTSVAPVDAGFAIRLDGRAVKTPAKTELAVPTRILAEAIAAEWEAQTDRINPLTMPCTRSSNSAIDTVAQHFDTVVDTVSEYGGSDLLCYRADRPAKLFQQQAEAWDPLLQWSRDRFDALLIPTQGVMHIAQPEESLRKLRAHVSEMTAFELAGLHDLVTLSGSLVLGLAVSENHLPAQEAWEKSRIDETWQEQEWGLDEEASLLSAAKKADFLAAFRFLSLARNIPVLP